MAAAPTPDLEATLRSGGDGPSPRVRRAVFAKGRTVGRYVVLERIGEGGMGVVYAAYDPELDRRVAIKVVRPRAGGSDAAEHESARLQREAQVLAKLAHPNVVAIHDVGQLDGRVWLAMEYVEGQTLTAWAATPRAWTSVVEVMREAGLGLAAAHDADLLHRDFKPDNVMVSLDGSGAGADNARVAGLLSNLGDMLTRQRRFDESLVLHQRAVAIRRATLGDTHPLLAMSLYNLAESLRNLGRYDEAEEHHRAALQIREHAVGEGHAWTGDSLAALGKTLAHQGRADAARPLLQRASSVYATLPDQSERWEQTRQALADLDAAR